MDLSQFTVVTDGNIDVEASVTKFRNALVVAAEARKNDLEVIASGVSALFDQYRGSYIQIDAIKSMVINKLNVHPNAYGVVGDRIHGYIQENTEAGNGITKEGKPALFMLKKGKGGGFCRKADMKAPVTA